MGRNFIVKSPSIKCDEHLISASRIHAKRQAKNSFFGRSAWIQKRLKRVGHVEAMYVRLWPGVSSWAVRRICFKIRCWRLAVALQFRVV